MAGADENLVVMSDWCPPSPSPRTFFSSLLRDGISAISRSNVPKDNEGQCLPPGPVNQKAAISLEDEANEAGAEGLLESNALSVQKPSPRSSLAERMAARAGFSAPILNTSRIVDLSSPEGRSTFLTIPPGLSPTTLFDSPVFLSNSLSQQSPTTGKFSFPPLGERGPIPLSTASKEGKDGSFGNINVAPFAFKPHLQSSSSCFSSGANIVAAPTSQHQPLPRIEVSVLPAQPTQAQNLEVTTSQQELQPYQIFSDEAVKQKITCLMSNEIACHNAENKQSLDALEEVGEDYRGEFSSTVVEAPSEDGYNWRKYGQKQVKGSEFPRSYYKCTHPNCQVKKKVERSYEGHVTEIIYKGAHSHPKPPASRGSAFGSSSQPPTDQQKGDQVGMDVERSMWGGTGNCMETGSSEFCDPSTTGPVQDRRGLQTPPLDVSSPESNADDDDDEADGTVSLVHDDEGDESESKRRKMDSSVTEMCGATRAIREPRVVVQTTSEVDVLDDGYRWRKYGQKVVKGNPNPRSYYKCTNTGCTVRKHVERASHDLKAVITTYEGKHNHDVPAAKTNSHVNSGPSSLPTLPPVPFLPRQQPSQLHGEMPRFENPVLNTFGLPGRQLSGPTGFSFAVGQQSFSNLAMARLGSATQGKMPGLQMQHSYFGHQVKVNELGLMISKGEPKKESMLESNLPVGHGSSVYYQLMSRLPL